MAIRFQCPHGHALKVDDNLAGKTGRCPRCSAMIQIPKPKPKPQPQPKDAGNGELSEDAIIDILGGPMHAPPTKRQHDVHGSHANDSQRRGGSHEHEHEDAGDHDPHGHDSPPMKGCPRCNQQIPTASHICPHCHTYIANLAGR